jgi:hypothetical protein
MLKTLEQKAIVFNHNLISRALIRRKNLSPSKIISKKRLEGTRLSLKPLLIGYTKIIKERCCKFEDNLSQENRQKEEG